MTDAPRSQGDVIREQRAHIEALEREVAETREHLAQWMIERSFATGHGDTIADLLGELGPQIVERVERVRAAYTKENAELQYQLTLARAQVREQAAKVCDDLGDKEFERKAKRGGAGLATLAQMHYLACAAAIRAMKLEG